jgi:galactokinase
VPIGAGLSSSAAIEVATAMAFHAVSGIEIEKMKLALLCQKAENEFIGMRCGIMDQFISVFGQEEHAVFLDCQTMAHEAVPLNAVAAKVVICNSGVKHELAGSAYNERRATCEAAIARIHKRRPRVETFHDLTPELFAQAEGDLDATMRKRARHVVSENARVLNSIAALKAGKLGEFGRHMNASHDSLRDDYEVSCAELDLMVNLAREIPGTLGARLTGAGFGGCTVNLVKTEAVAAFCDLVPRQYGEQTGIEAAVYVVTPGAGAMAQLAAD